MSEGGLVHRAEACINCLTVLRTDAELAQQTHTSSDSQTLLNRVVASCDDHIRRLADWKDFVGKSDQTVDPKIQEPIQTAFAELDACIEKTQSTLSARLAVRYRNLTAVPFVK